MSDNCPICGCNTLETKTGEYSFDPPPQIPGGQIKIQNTTWEECSTCGETILSIDLEQSLEKERYKRLGLLTPKEIQKIRKQVGLNQTEMAYLLGIGEKTYTRWESGKSLHNKSSDNLIRLVYKNPEIFVQIEAQRNPEREKLILDYINNLGNIKGKNPHAIAAHDGEIDQGITNELRQRILKIIQLKKDF